MIKILGVGQLSIDLQFPFHVSIFYEDSINVKISFIIVHPNFLPKTTKYMHYVSWGDRVMDTSVSLISNFTGINTYNL